MQLTLRCGCQHLWPNYRSERWTHVNMRPLCVCRKSVIHTLHLCASLCMCESESIKGVLCQQHSNLKSAIHMHESFKDRSLCFHLSFSSQLSSTEQEAPDDETFFNPKHLPCPQGPDCGAWVHCPRPVSVCVCIRAYSWPHQSENFNCFLWSILPASHPSLSDPPTALHSLHFVIYHLLSADNSALCCLLIFMFIFCPLPLPFTHHIPLLVLSTLCHLHPSWLIFPILANPVPLSFLLFSPTPDVMWLRKDGELFESRTTKDMFDRRLRFNNISESDAGEYQCRANNSQGKITHTYTVIVEGTSYKHI